MPIPSDRATLTFEGCLQGARMTLPLLPSLTVFAAAFGSLAAQKGITWDQALAMSGIVFAGASQMVSIEIWREVWSLPALLEVMAVTAFVNARMILMSASLQPWLKHASGPQQFSCCSCLRMPIGCWECGTARDGGRDLGIFWDQAWFSGRMGRRDAAGLLAGRSCPNRAALVSIFSCRSSSRPCWCRCGRASARPCRGRWRDVSP